MKIRWYLAEPEWVHQRLRHAMPWIGNGLAESYLRKHLNIKESGRQLWCCMLGGLFVLGVFGLITEWLDGYDPDELDVFPIEVALGRIAARRNAAAKRIIKPENN